MKIIKTILMTYLISFSVLQAEPAKPFGNDILLLINFNHPFYDCIDFLKELYAPYFPNIVFYGEKEHPDIHVCKHNLGWYAYKALADAMQRYPGYRGYFMTHDDAIINPWNLSRLDKDKLWFVSGAEEPSILEKNVDWVWWANASGQQAIARAYQKLPADYLNMLCQNLGMFKAQYVYSDVFYIPNRLTSQFIELSNLFAKENVFLEVAIPMMCNALEPKQDWETLKGYTWWWWFPDEDGIGKLKKIGSNANNWMRIGLKEYNMVEKYSPIVDFLHPIKLSKEENQDFLRMQFSMHKNI